MTSVVSGYSNKWIDGHYLFFHTVVMLIYFVFPIPFSSVCSWHTLYVAFPCLIALCAYCFLSAFLTPPSVQSGCNNHNTQRELGAHKFWMVLRVGTSWCSTGMEEICISVFNTEGSMNFWRINAEKEESLKRGKKSKPAVAILVLRGVKPPIEHFCGP